MTKRAIYLLLSLMLLLAGSSGCATQKSAVMSNAPQPQQVAQAAPLGVPVRVLYYHLIDDHLYGPYTSMFVSPGEFDKQMNYLKSNGYTVIPLDEIENAGQYAKPVIITFDDGYEDNYTNAYPILEKYHFPATVFLISSFIGKPGYLNQAEILKMEDIFTFQSHTVTHRLLATLSPQVQDYELGESKKEIEAITGQGVDALAYPTGSYDQTTIAIARRYYKFAFLMVPSGIYLTGDDPYTIRRLNISRSLSMDGFVKKIQGI
jgi:peptidoglycan/xylan/chitin deacetylase (PgdA/CDA1 family)